MKADVLARQTRGPCARAAELLLPARPAVGGYRRQK